MSEVEFVEIMQEHSCEDTSAHIALEIKQKDALMGWPGDNLQNPDSRADGEAEEWSENVQKKQETYAAADQDISEHLKENSKLNINDENSSHNEVDVTCIDGEISKNKSPTMKNHITHNAINPHRCQTCGKEFALFERLKIHMDTHIGTERYRCEACGEKFGKFHELKRHVEAHASIEKHECGTCGKECSRSDHLKTHIKLTGHKHKHKCIICSQPFGRSSDLKKHMNKAHTELKKHKCMICSKAYGQSDHLKRHMATHEPHELMILNEEEFVRCEKLKSHVEAYAGIKKHKCGTCGKEFSRSDCLKTHMIIHTGLKKHKCMICSKAFGRSDHLKSHMATHKPHELVILNEEEFVRCEKLKSHVEAYAGIKELKCGTCGKEFSRSDCLKSHMITHVKKHKCMICGKTFGRSDHLKKHENTHPEKIAEIAARWRLDDQNRHLFSL